MNTITITMNAITMNTIIITMNTITVISIVIWMNNITITEDVMVDLSMAILKQWNDFVVLNL